MRKFALGLVALTFASSAALAQTPITFAQVDLDGDGRLSFAELQAVWPDITPEEFAAVDVEGAGSFSPAQLDTLQPGAVGAASDNGASTEVTGGVSVESGVGLEPLGSTDAGTTLNTETPRSLLDESDD